jgi:two-component system response regulator HydG
MPGKILVIDDERSIRMSFQKNLEKAGHTVTTVADYASALEQIATGAFDLIFADILLPDLHTGIEILQEVSNRGLHCPVIMITGVPELETAAESVRLGAYDYVPKPINKAMLLRITRQALHQKFLHDEKDRIAAENERHRRHLDAIFRSVQEGIITVDAEMRVIDANEAAIRLCQLNPQNLIGHPLTELLDEGCGACSHVLQKTLDSKHPVQEYRVECQRAKRPRQIVMVNSAPLIARDKTFLGAILVLRDMTRVMSLEQTLKERYRFQNIIGKSPHMQEIYDLLESLTETNTTVLITGETGTGKERVAEALHYNSPGAVKPFVKVNCSALAENLLESELFGHVKGAFTGAIKEKIGRFQLAEGGTIFLDEIGDLSPTLQIKLLRVLQEKTFEKVGDPEPITVELRVIAATNRDLRAKIQQGEFREDLYYRLKVVEIALPPLRERDEDIPLLVNHFCEHFNNTFQKQIVGVSDTVLDLFMNYPWPGNVRELEHALEHAFVVCRGNRIEAEHVPQELSESAVSQTRRQEAPLPDEAETIRQALHKTGWNKAKAARLLGLARQTLYRKINHYHLREPGD